MQPRIIVALLALSLLWAAGPLRSELLPEQFSASLPRLFAQALPLLLLAVTAGTFAWRRKAQWPRGGHLRSSIWIGVGLFTAPALLVYLSTDWVSGFARTALFTLVPVFSIVLEPYLGAPATRPIHGALPAAFIAVLGALLVFPTPNPASIQAILAIVAVILAAACIAAANCYAVAIFRDPGLSSAASVSAIAATAGAVTLGIASLFLERSRLQSAAFASELLWAAAIELPALLLLFWLMQRVTAVRTATRFLLGPLLVVPIGALVIQWPLAPRTWLGLLGMVAGAGYLLLAPETAPAPATLLGRDPEA